MTSLGVSVHHSAARLLAEATFTTFATNMRIRKKLPRPTQPEPQSPETVDQSALLSEAPEQYGRTIAAEISGSRS